MLLFFRKYKVIIVYVLLISCLMNIVLFTILINKTRRIISEADPIILNSIQEKNEIVDYEYKLFYGEWEVKEFINFTASIPKSTTEEGRETQYPDIIGTKIYYNRDTIMNDDKIVCKSPIYSIGVIPVLENEQLFLGKHSMSIKELGIKGEYFNFVTVICEDYIDNVSNEIVGISFYIVDNNTLILEYNACEFIMKRTAFIENVDMFESEHN